MKVLVFPINSLVLSDVVQRLGHEPLTMMGEMRVRSKRGKGRSSAEGAFEPKRGLKYAPVEVPSGVRGRLDAIGALIEKADAAVIMEDAEFGYGCGGCARTNELVPYIVAQQGIPYIKVDCPTDLESAKVMVQRIKDFLEKLEAER